MKINGLPVKDVTRKYVLHITDGDCRNGKNKNPAKCAAALACERELECDEARVHLSRTYIRKGKEWFRLYTPHSLRAEIIAFDRGGSFSPGDYILCPMTSADRATGKKQRNPDKKAPTGRKKFARTRHVVLGVRQYGANR